MVRRPDIQFLISTCYSRVAEKIVADYLQGMAPTLLVACVALGANHDVHEAPSTHVSGFAFHARSTHVYLTRSASEN